MRDSWVVNNPRWITGFLTLLVAAAVLFLGGDLWVLALTLVLAVLAYSIADRSHRHFVQIRDQELATALKNLSRGSYISLPRQAS